MLPNRGALLTARQPWSGGGKGRSGWIWAITCDPREDPWPKTTPQHSTALSYGREADYVGYSAPVIRYWGHPSATSRVSVSREGSSWLECRRNPAQGNPPLHRQTSLPCRVITLTSGHIAAYRFAGPSAVLPEGSRPFLQTDSPGHLRTSSGPGATASNPATARATPGRSHRTLAGPPGTYPGHDEEMAIFR